MDHLKVALFTGNYNHIRDGVSLTLNRWVSFLLENEVEVLVFGPTVENPDVDHNGELVEVPSKAAPGRPEYRVTTGFPDEQREKLEEFNPDLIHIATPDILGYKALKWAEKMDRPIVSSYHTHFTSYLKYYWLGLFEPLGWSYLRWFYSHCEQIYVPTLSMADELKKKGIGQNEHSLYIWARGVDTDLFNPDKRSETWRTENGFSKDDVVITFVSRLVWEKNLKLYAKVVRRLEAEFGNVKSLVVGDGPAMEGMQKLLPETVFAGFLEGDDLATAYASSDIFFFPSDTETFGNVTLEAMASGLPCLVADAAGSKSLVKHGLNGFLSDVKDRERFYLCAKELVVKPQVRREMGENSSRRAGDFTWDKINKELLMNYHQVVSPMEMS